MLFSSVNRDFLFHSFSARCIITFQINPPPLSLSGKKKRQSIATPSQSSASSSSPPPPVRRNSPDDGRAASLAGRAHGLRYSSLRFRYGRLIGVELDVKPSPPPIADSALASDVSFYRLVCRRVGYDVSRVGFRISRRSVR